jgi:hypothetical protein
VFQINLDPEARAQLEHLQKSPAFTRQYKAASKAIWLLAENPRHPGLHTHEFKGRACPHGGKLFEAYAQNRTPGAYRVFWCYEPGARDTVPIVAITPHP